MKDSFSFFILVALLGCGHSDRDQPPVYMNPPEADQTPLGAFVVGDQGVFAAKIEWKQPPRSRTLDNEATVILQNKDGQTAANSQLTRFHLFMTTMGHPSTKEKEIKWQKIDGSRWKVSNIYFSMGGSAGSWVVDLEASVQGQEDKVRVSVDYEVL